jgi:hypothetical protein
LQRQIRLDRQTDGKIDRQRLRLGHVLEKGLQREGEERRTDTQTDKQTEKDLQRQIR